jgi:hypothetical protein
MVHAVLDYPHGLLAPFSPAHDCTDCARRQTTKLLPLAMRTLVGMTACTLIGVDSGSAGVLQGDAVICESRRRIARGTLRSRAPVAILPCMLAGIPHGNISNNAMFALDWDGGSHRKIYHF